MRVLFLTHRLPYTPNRGDRVRAFNIVRTLAPVSDLHVVSLVHDDHEQAQVPLVEALGARVTAFRTRGTLGYLRAAASLPGTQPLTHVLLDAPGISAHLAETVRQSRPDVVLAYCSGMARFAVEGALASRPFVLDMVDVDSAKWAALSVTSSWPRSWIFRREARLLERFERQAAERAASVLVVNERERDTMAAIAPAARVEIVRNGVSLDALRPASPPAEAPRVVFCGVMNYAPNVDAVRWFAQDVWPLVRASRADATFQIVGSDPSESVRRLASESSGISVTGAVPDVRQYLWESAVSVAPLRTARGVQNKVLEAIAAGLPVVVTGQVAAGLPPGVGCACREADDARAFADAVIELLALSAAERRAMSLRADLRPLSWESQLGALVTTLAAAR